MNEHRLPDTNFDFMQEVYHQHVKHVKAKRGQFIRESILKESNVNGSHISEKKTLTILGTRESRSRSLFIAAPLTR